MLLLGHFTISYCASMILLNDNTLKSSASFLRPQYYIYFELQFNAVIFRHHPNSFIFVKILFFFFFVYIQDSFPTLNIFLQFIWIDFPILYNTCTIVELVYHGNFAAYGDTCQWGKDNSVWYLSTGCEVYNLGTGKGTSVLEMVSAFEKASGKVRGYSISPLMTIYVNNASSLTQNDVSYLDIMSHINI